MAPAWTAKLKQALLIKVTKRGYIRQVKLAEWRMASKLWVAADTGITALHLICSADS